MRDRLAVRLPAWHAGPYPLVSQGFTEPVGVVSPVGSQPFDRRKGAAQHRLRARRLETLLLLWGRPQMTLRIQAQAIRSVSQLVVQGPIGVVVLISTQGFQDQIPFLDREVRACSGAVWYKISGNLSRWTRRHREDSLLF